MNKKNNVFIYTLSDPDTLQIKYVGKTSKSLEERLKSHIKDSKYRKKLNKRLSWIRSLIDKNKIPIIEQLDTVEEVYANDIEIYWISQFRQWGFDLKNSTEGGEGITMNEEVKSKIKNKLKNRIVSEDTKLKMSKSRLGKSCPWNVRMGENNINFGKNLKIAEKVILQINKNGEIIKEWPSAFSAFKILKINYTNISRVCNGERKSAGGFLWKFK